MFSNNCTISTCSAQAIVEQCRWQTVAYCGSTQCETVITIRHTENRLRHFSSYNKSHSYVGQIHGYTDTTWLSTMISASVSAGRQTPWIS